MVGIILRILWRLLVFGLFISLIWLTVRLFPYADQRLPLFVVLLLVYCLFAYGILPLLTRVWRIFIKPNHLPHYVISRDGWPSDPINIAIVCKSRRQLRRQMEAAGWHKADKPTVRNMLREAYAIVFETPYLTAPFSNLYLFGRHQDIGFQIQTGDRPSPRHRHHVRFWRLIPDDTNPHHHLSFWENILRFFKGKNRQIWVGAATHDTGPFALRISNLQITHKIDERTHIERDYLIDTLKKSKSIKRQETISAGDPVSFRGQTFGVNILTDGTLQVVELKGNR